MRISLLQTDIIWNNPESNIEKYNLLLNQVKEHKSDLYIFPEMFTTGFSFLSGLEAKDAEELSSKFLEDSASLYNTYIAASMPEVATLQDKPKNTLKLYGPNGKVGSYSKIHLFSYSGEDKKYQSGDKAFTSIINNCKVTFFICYDLRFPNFFSALAKDSDLFVVVANWPETRQLHWESLLKARAIENQVYVAGVNRVGAGGSLNYIGGSQLISPKGETLIHLGSAPNSMCYDLDLNLLKDYRRDFPVLNDRRNELYNNLI
jgi:predicted amidohydrolase